MSNPKTVTDTLHGISHPHDIEKMCVESVEVEVLKKTVRPRERVSFMNYQLRPVSLDDLRDTGWTPGEAVDAFIERKEAERAGYLVKAESCQAQIDRARELLDE